MEAESEGEAGLGVSRLGVAEGSRASLPACQSVTETENLCARLFFGLWCYGGDSQSLCFVSPSFRRRIA